MRASRRPRGSKAPGSQSQCQIYREANARLARASCRPPGSPPSRRRVAGRAAGRGRSPLPIIRTTRCSAAFSCFRRPWNHRSSDAKARLTPGSALGHRGSNLSARGLVRPPTSPRLAISAAGPADGRPSSLPNAVLAPRSGSGASPTRRSRLADRPRACAALATSLERRGSRAAWRARRCAGRVGRVAPGGQWGAAPGSEPRSLASLVSCEGCRGWGSRPGAREAASSTSKLYSRATTVLE